MKKRSEATREKDEADEARELEKLVEEAGKAEEQPKKGKRREVVIHHSTTNEIIVLAAALSDEGVADKIMAKGVTAESFLEPKHRAAFRAIVLLRRQKLSHDLATLEQLGAEGYDADYVGQVAEARPYPPPNLDFHLDRLQWDRGRHALVTGPLSALIEAVKDPRETPERVQALARAVPEALDGYKSRTHVLDGREVVRQQMREIRERSEGLASYSYGIPGLDFFEDGTRRILPGPAPGQVTVVVGVSGSGKSTLVANMISAARKHSRVAVFAWEMKSGPTCSLVTAIEEGISRTKLMSSRAEGGGLSEDELHRFEQRALEIQETTRWIDNPFLRQRGERIDRDDPNGRNLDLFQQHVAETGAKVVFVDLWRRMLRKGDPEEEEQALYRTQAIALEMNVHLVLVHQIRLKDLEARVDKRPTRETIKGSGAWIEVPDTILATHRAALFKSVSDKTMEIRILKQRNGAWPLAVECDFDPVFGKITGGRTVEFEHDGGESSTNEFDGRHSFPEPKRGGRQRPKAPRGRDS